MTHDTAPEGASTTSPPRFHCRYTLLRTCFFPSDDIVGNAFSGFHGQPALLPHWFTLSVVGPHQSPLFHLDVSLLDYVPLPPSSHPVRRVLPWYGLLTRRELSLAWALYPPHTASPPPEAWMWHRLELDALPDLRPWEITPLVNWMLKESLRRHDRLQRLSSLEVTRRIRPSRLAWEQADGRFFVFTGTLWLSICPESWLLQEYCECLPPSPGSSPSGSPSGETEPDLMASAQIPVSSLVLISHPSTGHEICLRPLLGHAFCPFPSVWDTSALWDEQLVDENPNPKPDDTGRLSGMI